MQKVSATLQCSSKDEFVAALTRDPTAKAFLDKIDPFDVYPAAKFSPRTGPTILPDRVFTQPVEQLLRNEFRQDKKAQYPTWTVHLCIAEHFNKDWRVTRKGKAQQGTVPVKEENVSLGLPLTLPTRKGLLLTCRRRCRVQFWSALVLRTHHRLCTPSLRMERNSLH